MEWFDLDLINYEMIRDNYFKQNVKKKEVVLDIFQFYYLERCVF